MDNRKQIYSAHSYKPTLEPSQLYHNSYYLKEVDQKYRRFYQLFPNTYHANTYNTNNTNTNNPNPTNHCNTQKSYKYQTAGLNRLQLIKNSLSKPLTNNSIVESSKWNGFYRKSIQQRQSILKTVQPNVDYKKIIQGQLTLQKADLMIENCIGKISLPLGVIPAFLINNKSYVIPLATQESSIVAACCSISKLMSSYSSSFHTLSTSPIMIGQIHFTDVSAKMAQYQITNNESKLIAIGNLYIPNMVKRGGGIQKIKSKIIDGGFVVQVYVNVCESMGANIVNTICEKLASHIESIIGGRVGLKILTNLCTERKSLSYFQLKIQHLHYKDTDGEQVVKKILQAYQFAKNDIYRATTHNKGILNGIDSIAIATGQDWRAIESSCHAYAAITGKYQPLTKYSVVQKYDGKYFRGELELPISVGTVGGSLQKNSLYKQILKLMGNPNSQKLAEIMVSVGLAQNFAALRALAIQGIQKGHMRLHSRNLAIQAGIMKEQVENACKYMQLKGTFDSNTAKQYLQKLPKL